MKPRQQQLFIEPGFIIARLVYVFNVQLAPGEFCKLVDFCAAKGTCAIVVKRIFVHVLSYARFTITDQSVYF